MDSNEEQGVCYRQPVTFEDRLAIARDFVRSSDYEIPLAIDRLDNAANELYAGWPERFYVIERGTIAYKGATGPFGYHPDEVAAWLMRRFPPETPPPNAASDVSAQRIASDPLSIVALECADGRPVTRIALDGAGSARVGSSSKAQTLTVDAESIASLRRALLEQDFFRWREASGTPNVDGRARSLAVQLGATYRIVHAYLPPADERSAPAEPVDARFDAVWELVRAAVARE